jgi:hypothetical protein
MLRSMLGWRPYPGTRRRDDVASECDDRGSDSPAATRRSAP